MKSSFHFVCLVCAFCFCCGPFSLPGSVNAQSESQVSTVAEKDEKPAAPELSDDELELVRKLEGQRIKAIDKVIGSVIAIYDEKKGGGGSGVVIHPSGIALTNHHVIMGAGVEGWGGLSDGKLYHWKLIGTDPGGDVSIIQMEGRDDFPFTPLGDSDMVRVGDWALAMGNPFILTEDQSPTVTLGIVSGIKRYQPGAGQNQLVYGNCIQVDSSINPGNSGGPLFNMFGEVIGINGRGSFQDRGRVNVGLGYAISSNQIKNFIPDLLATKLVEHATLDANFTQRQGKIVCSTLNRASPIAEAGLDLGDELLEFEGVEITSSNQFTNLICTLPEDWPTHLKIKDKEGVVKDISVRSFGLPYAKPKKRKGRGGEGGTPEEKEQEKKNQAMIKLLSAEPGEVRYKKVNQKYADLLMSDWKKGLVGGPTKPLLAPCWKIVDRVEKDGEKIGSQTTWLFGDRFRVEWNVGDTKSILTFDGKTFQQQLGDDETQKLTLVEAKTLLPVVAAYGLSAQLQREPFNVFGETTIDASDKSRGQASYRMKTVDDDEDPFFFWLTFEDGAHDNKSGESLSHVISKVSAYRDCTREGGVVYTDYQKFSEVEHIWIAKTRLFVSGLNETVQMSLVNETVELKNAHNVKAIEDLIEKLPPSEEVEAPGASADSGDKEDKVESEADKDETEPSENKDQENKDDN